MKKILFALSMFMMIGVASNAQSCTKGAKKKGCCAKKAALKADAATKTTSVAAVLTEAKVAANANENIEARTCEKSGTTSFFEKSVCAKSGSVSWNEVKFDESDKKFTRVAAVTMEKGAKKECSKSKKCCSKADAKKCSKDGAKKACCKKGAKASCDKKKS